MLDRMHVPSLSPPSWNKLLPPFRTGPQLTIFGTSTKVSLIHSTNSRGTLKSAGIHSSSLGSGPQKSPGPPSRESWVLENEPPGRRGSESAGGLGCGRTSQCSCCCFSWFLFLGHSGHLSSHSICLAAYYQSLFRESGTKAQREQAPSLGHTADTGSVSHTFS